MKRTLPVVLAALLAGCASAAHAQSGVASNGFQFRFGGFFPQGGGEFWDQTEDTFTFDISDLEGFAFGMTYVTAFNNHLEVGANMDFYDAETTSAYSGISGPPIFHDSELSTVPLTVDFRVLPGGRYRLRPEGRSVIQPVFYLGGGLGMTFWEYEEAGDFVDFSLPGLPIFYDRFVDDGTAFEAHALAGVELPLSPYFNVLVEGRYAWCDDTLGGDFAGLGQIELGGLSVYFGGAFRF